MRIWICLWCFCMLFESQNPQLHEKNYQCIFLFSPKNFHFFVFHIRNKAILVWNNMRVSRCVIFGWTTLMNSNIVFQMSDSFQAYATYFFTSTALVGELLLKTRDTEVIVIFRDERLGSYWLLTALTQKARLMPAVPFVLHFSCS